MNVVSTLHEQMFGVKYPSVGRCANRGFLSTLLMEVRHFFRFVWEGVVVELPAGEYCTLLER